MKAVFANKTFMLDVFKQPLLQRKLPFGLDKLTIPVKALPDEEMQRSVDLSVAQKVPSAHMMQLLNGLAPETIFIIYTVAKIFNQMIKEGENLHELLCNQVVKDLVSDSLIKCLVL